MPSPLYNRRDFASNLRANENGCLNWTGSIDREGYGRAGLQLAHRAAYRKFVGEIPEGHHIHHTCGNKSCCNPDHLQPIPPGEHALISNVGSKKPRRRGYCPKGHSYDGMNSEGSRVCKRCKADIQKRYIARKEARFASADDSVGDFGISR